MNLIEAFMFMFVLLLICTLGVIDRLVNVNNTTSMEFLSVASVFLVVILVFGYSMMELLNFRIRIRSSDKDSSKQL